MYVTTRALSVRVKCARVYSFIMYCMSVNVKYTNDDLFHRLLGKTVSSGYFFNR